MLDFNGHYMDMDTQNSGSEVSLNHDRPNPWGNKWLMRKVELLISYIVISQYDRRITQNPGFIEGISDWPIKVYSRY